MVTEFEKLAQPMSRVEDTSEAPPPPKPTAEVSEFERLATAQTSATAPTSVDTTKIRRKSSRRTAPAPTPSAPSPEPETRTKTTVGVIDTEKQQTQRATSFEAAASREIARRQSLQTSVATREETIEERALRSSREGKRELIFFETTEEGEKIPLTIIEKEEKVLSKAKSKAIDERTRDSRGDTGIPVDTGDISTPSFFEKAKTKTGETIEKLKSFAAGTKERVKEKGRVESAKIVGISAGKTIGGFAKSFVKGAVKLSQPQHFGEESLEVSRGTPLTEKLSIDFFKKSGEISKGFVTTDPLGDPDVQVVGTVATFGVAAAVLPPAAFITAATAVVGASSVGKIVTTVEGQELQTAGAILGEVSLLAVPVVAKAKNIPFFSKKTTTSDIRLTFEPKTQTIKGTGSQIPSGARTADIVLKYETTAKRFGLIKESRTTTRITPEGGIKQKTVGKGFKETITQAPKSDIAIKETFKSGKLKSSETIKGFDQKNLVNLDAVLKAERTTTVSEIVDPGSGRQITQAQQTSIKGRIDKAISGDKVIRGDIEQSVFLLKRDTQPRAKVSTKDIVVDKEVTTGKATIREVPLKKSTEDVLLKIVEKPKPKESLITETSMPKVEQVFLSEKSAVVQTITGVKQTDIPLLLTEAKRVERVSGVFRIEDAPKPTGIFTKFFKGIKKGKEAVFEPIGRKLSERDLSSQLSKIIQKEKQAIPKEVKLGDELIQETVGAKVKVVEVEAIKPQKATELKVPRELLVSDVKVKDNIILIAPDSTGDVKFIPVEGRVRVGLRAESAFIPVSDRKVSTEIKIEDLQTPKERTTAISEPFSKARSRSKSVQEVQRKQIQELKVEQRLEQTMEQQVGQAVKQSLKLDLRQKMALASLAPPSAKPILLMPSMGFGSPSVQEALFDVEVGKEANVFFFKAEDLTESQVKEFVKKKVLGTAAASFEVSPANILAKKKISGVESFFSKRFVKSKVSPERFVQAREERISSEGEKFDITLKGIEARRSGKSKKIFGVF